MFRTVSLSIIRSLFAVHSAVVYVIQVVESFQAGPGRKAVYNPYDIYHWGVYSEKTPDDGQRNCLKHVEFHAKINL